MKVSIIIPAYNCGQVLSQTIASAIGQSWPNKEVIIIDDGSTDDTLAVARSFESESVKVFSQPNAGACKARNTGLSKSCGDFIQYLDGDDLLSRDKVRYQMERLLGQDDDDIVASSRLVRFSEDANLPDVPAKLGFLEKDWDDPIEWLIHEWEGKGMGQTSIWLTPRKLILAAGGWDERLSINQDGEFFARVLMNARAIRFVKESVVYYRSGNNLSVSQKKTARKASDLLLSYRLYEQSILRKETTERVKHAVASKYLSFVYSFFDSHPDKAREAFDHLSTLGLNKYPETGGRNFRIVARILGFENALKIRSLLRRASVSK